VRNRVVLFSFALLCAIGAPPGRAQADVAPPLAQVQMSATVLVPIRYSFVAPFGWQTVIPTNTSMSWAALDNGRHILIFGGVVARAADLEARATAMIGDARRAGGTVVDEGPVTGCEGRPAHRWTLRDVEDGVPKVSHVLMEPVASGLAMLTYAHPAAEPDRPDALDFLNAFCPRDRPDQLPALGTIHPPAAQSLPAAPMSDTGPVTFPLLGNIGFSASGPLGWKRIATSVGAAYMIVGTDGPHEFIITALPSITMDPTGRARHEMDVDGKRPDVTIVDDGPGNFCNGQRGYRWTERRTMRGLPFVSHFTIVSAMAGYGVAMYMHFDTVADRPDGVAALQNFCPPMAVVTPTMPTPAAPAPTTPP
jgi:hypothetical protein